MKRKSMFHFDCYVMDFSVNTNDYFTQVKKHIYFVTNTRYHINTNLFNVDSLLNIPTNQRNPTEVDSGYDVCNEINYCSDVRRSPL